MYGMKFGIVTALAILANGVPAESQPVATPLTYADLTDLAFAAPVAAHVRLARAIRLKKEKAVDVMPGKSRFYVEADVVSALRAPGGVPARVSYLVDLPNDAKGRPAKLEKKSEYLIWASAVGGRPGELRLAASDAQLPWSAAQGDRVRHILAEANAAGAPPKITGIGRAFNVPGSLPGESETQIFLQTADERPVSLSILRRPGEQPRWSVALAEIVDDAAAAPARDTLLWYRLACTLPRLLPRQSFADATPEQMTAIQADYRLVLDQLGTCTRNRSRS